MSMKNVLTVFAILVLLAACAPQQQVTPAAQPPAVIAPQIPVEQPPAQQPASEPAMQETAPAAGKQVHDVDIKGFKFLPAVVTVRKGDTVRWVNMDNVPHDATGDGWATRTPLRKGETAEVTFDTPGTYDYICSIHPNMKAQVVVE